MNELQQDFQRAAEKMPDGVGRPDDRHSVRDAAGTWHLRDHNGAELDRRSPSPRLLRPHVPLPPSGSSWTWK
jgi:hypothetical protein